MASKPPKKKQNPSTKTTKLTKNQQEWEKQAKRVRAALRRTEKSGYSIDPVFKESLEKTIAKRPARVQKKTLEALKEIRPKEIRQHAWWADPDTGEAIPAQEHFAKEQKRKRESRNKSVKDESGYISSIDMVKGLILDCAESAYWVNQGEFHDLSGSKNALLDVINARIDVARNHGTLKEYAEYLTSAETMEAINQAVELFVYKYSWSYEEGKARLIAILGNGVVSKQEQEDIDENLQILSSWYGDDY